MRRGTRHAARAVSGSCHVPDKYDAKLTFYFFAIPYSFEKSCNCNLPSADDLLTNNWVREGTGLVFHFILLQGQLLSGHWSCCIDKYPPQCRAWSPGSLYTISVNGESVIALDERLQAIAAEAERAVIPRESLEDGGVEKRTGRE